MKLTTAAAETPDESTASQPALRARHETEAAFHDHKYATGDSFPRHYAVNPTYPVFVRVLDLMGEDLRGKHVLEYGCGTGWSTLELAARGARVSAFDISAEAVSQARELLRTRGFLAQCDVRVMAAEALDYPDATFDAAVGFAILHHLEIPKAVAELHRVLKPRGEALFAEPLGTNPLINLYRRLTPQYRTPDEAPIDVGALRGQLAAFSRFEHHDQLLLATAALALAYVPGMSGAARAAQRWLMRVDDVVLRVAPWAGSWAWYSILCLEK